MRLPSHRPSYPLTPSSHPPPPQTNPHPRLLLATSPPPPTHPFQAPKASSKATHSRTSPPHTHPGYKSVPRLIDIQSIVEAMGFYRVGLKSLSQLMLHPSYSKSKAVTCSNWEAEGLSQKQVRCVYAGGLRLGGRGVRWGWGWGVGGGGCWAVGMGGVAFKEPCSNVTDSNGSNGLAPQSNHPTPHPRHTPPHPTYTQPSHDKQVRGPRCSQPTGDLPHPLRRPPERGHCHRRRRRSRRPFTFHPSRRRLPRLRSALWRAAP